MAAFEIGVLVRLTENPEEEIRKVAEFGLHSCQVCTWNPDVYTDTVGETLIEAAHRYDVDITTLWAGYQGPLVWNFNDGPRTIGLVPPEYRAMRLEVLEKAARFAAKFALPSITTHVGFLPEDPNDVNYLGTLDALRKLVGLCRELGIYFCFETGQETPVTLLRTIERLGRDNLGINLDTANLILYGKANPVDALDVFGRYVRGVHAKDGFYPTSGDELGKEVPLGEGKVDFPALLARLKEIGYTGALTIEREITGPQQAEDIQAGVEYLRSIIQGL